MQQTRGRMLRAFTLVELLILIAIFALLLGILVPALAGARGTAREAACAAMQRQLHAAVTVHAMSHDGWLPGVNTTGRRYLGSVSNQQQLLYDTTPYTPTTTFDWISPAIGLDAGLSSNRARRTKQIFEDLGCAGATAQNARTWPIGATHADYHEFVDLLETEGIGQVSYLAPGPFHYAGPLQPASQYRRFGWSGPAIPPPKYLPRQERIGTQMAAKIFVADGTRYMTPNGLDFDLSPSPQYYGSFTSSTPIYESSTAYGRQPNNPEFPGELLGPVHQDNRSLSYRHAGRINVCWYDGHVTAMTEEDSKTRADYWYPTGSVFTGERATEESRQVHDEGEILP